MTLISAHRCGAEGDPAVENTREALERATHLAAEFVEFDVQRCADGTFVLFHDDHVTIGGRSHRLDAIDYPTLRAATSQLLRYEEALGILARGGKRAHIDLKFVSPDGVYDVPSETYEVEATVLAIEALGPGGFIVTSLEDRSVRAIRRWVKADHPELLVGLSLGRDLKGHRAKDYLKARWVELFPRIRIRDCDANLVVANKSLARLTLAAFAARQGLPLLIWTVDEPTELRRWLDDPRTWLVTTNFPARAADLREHPPARWWRGRASAAA